MRLLCQVSDPQPCRRRQAICSGPSLFWNVLSYRPLLKWEIPGILGGKWPLLEQPCRLPHLEDEPSPHVPLVSGLGRACPGSCIGEEILFDAPEGAHCSAPQGWGGSPGLNFSALGLTFFVAAGSALLLGNQLISKEH